MSEGNNLIHPIYGNYTPGWKVIPGFENYEVNDLSQVKNKKTGRVLKLTKTYMAGVCRNNKQESKLCYQLALLTFFQTVPRMETVDHIDENRSNNNIQNLQWSSKSENSRKSNKVKPRKGKHLRNCKPIEKWSKDGNLLISEYRSAVEASQICNINRFRIGKCLNGERKTTGGFIWKFKHQENNDNIPGEIWTSNEKVAEKLRKFNPKNPLTNNAISKVMVSSKGRILHVKGKKSKGKKCGKYRTYADQYVHALVWAAFGDRDPSPGKYILHDDSQPLDEDGCVSNAIEHLRIGTQSENIKECCAIGSRSKKRKISNE